MSLPKTEGPKSVLEGQVSKVRTMTRSQRPQGSKKGASPSQLEGGVCLNNNILLEKQLKDPACLDTLCWIRQGQRPEIDEILLSGLDLKFLWGNFECFVVQDGLLYKQIGPLVDGLSQRTVYVPVILRKEVIWQFHETHPVPNIWAKTIAEKFVLEFSFALTSPCRQSQTEGNSLTVNCSSTCATIWTWNTRCQPHFTLKAIQEWREQRKWLETLQPSFARPTGSGMGICLYSL